MKSRFEASCRSFQERSRVAEERLVEETRSLASLKTQLERRKSSCDEQKRVAAALDKLAAANNAARERIANLQASVAAVLREAESLEIQCASTVRAIKELEAEEARSKERAQRKSETDRANREAFTEFSTFVDVAAPELRQLLAKIRAENDSNLEWNEAAKLRLRERIQQLETARDENASRRPQPLAATPSGTDWRIKALQGDVESKDARIAELRQKLQRQKQLEAKLAVSADTVKGLQQSAEARQLHTLSRAKADAEWQNARHSTALSFKRDSSSS